MWVYFILFFMTATCQLRQIGSKKNDLTLLRLKNAVSWAVTSCVYRTVTFHLLLLQFSVLSLASYWAPCTSFAPCRLSKHFCVHNCVGQFDAVKANSGV